MILIIVGFLILLWAGEGPLGGQQAPNLWRRIMLSDGATRSITLSALILRVVTAAQAAVCTSLTAALLLERNQVRLSQLAQFSVTRGVNAGPRRILQEILVSGSSQLRLRYETLLLFTIAVLTIGIQFFHDSAP